MARFETERHANGRLPGRRPTFPSGDIRRGIEPEAGDDREGVAVARVNCDPLAVTALAETSKIGRAHRRLNQTRAAQRVGNRPGTIVCPIDKRGVAATETIWLGAKLVRCPNCAFYRDWRGLRRSSLAEAQLGLVSRHGRPGRRKGTGDYR